MGQKSCVKMLIEGTKRANRIGRAWQGEGAAGGTIL